MNLSVAISEAQTSNVPALLRWLRTAAAYWVEADEEGTLYVAVFDDWPKSAECVLRLLSEVEDLHNVRIALDGQPIADQTTFYQELFASFLSSLSGEECCREGKRAPTTSSLKIN
ncbi:MAG: dipeptidyl peptidase 3 [Nitrospira sp.]|nr:dipeptidyl peptidase 3 [Nitrospira sp.]